MKPEALIRPLIIEGNKIKILDQRKLPFLEEWLLIDHPQAMINAIQSLAVRGAPLLGLAGLGGIYLSALVSSSSKEHEAWVEKIINARPTAVQLSLVTRQAYQLYAHLSLHSQALKLEQHFKLVEKQLYQESEKIAMQGQTILPENANILTHCNTGSLAMGGWGTALGIFTYGFLKLKKKLNIFYTETRPLQQGLRLTGFELSKYGIPSQCITDSASAFMMRQGMIDLVITGADRIAVNGDTANKIGTLSIAIAATYHKIPFYIAAPLSTLDRKAENGNSFPIEYRSMDEISLCSAFQETRKIPKFQGKNPAFDITPFSLIDAYITEKGVLRPPLLID